MFTTRLANVDDAAVLTTLASMAPEGLISAPDDWEHRLGEIHDSGNTTVVAEVCGQVVAFLWADLAMHIDFELDLNWLCLNALFVDPASRDQGIGKALITNTVNWAQKLGIPVIHGSCLVESADWWRARGFTVAEPGAPWKTHVSVNGQRLQIAAAGDTCAMWLHLVPPVEVDIQK
ncbi:GNAT family N-acetyltransferase [Ilumatobacter sp.]|uniref:GNAT family N-acetyltransferase n=1 Tax=Ilumatobacter sp. TaxID=1967498 RepID=UPI003751CC47